MKPKTNWNDNSYKYLKDEGCDRETYSEVATLNDMIRARTNHYEGYFCRIYLCNAKATHEAGYCDAHITPLRAGKAPYTPGSCPVVHRKGNA